MVQLLGADHSPERTEDHRSMKASASADERIRSLEFVKTTEANG
jgi:hypothetical protein